MAHALVAPYAIKADGSVDATPLVPDVETDVTGLYRLSFTATKDQPYVIRVSAKADGSTTQLDEVTGLPQPLPAGFSMRTLFVPTTTGAITTSASITPFSEMAVAAAANAPGGVTSTNAAQAISTVTQLLGFNPTTVTPASVANASTDDQKKLAIMLTAVSQLAADSGLGCATGDAGAKVQCVVQALAQSASTSSIQLRITSGGTTLDVSAALATAVNTVLANPTLAGSISPATLTTVLASLDCTATNSCVAATPTALPAIIAAKTLLTEVKSDFTTMFSSGGVTGTAAVNAEGLKFQTAMKGVQLPAQTTVKDLGVLLMAADLYNDYRAGREPLNTRGRAPDQVSGTPTQGYNAVACTLYQDSGTVTPSTLPDNANYIGCRASYYGTITSTGATSFVRNDWRHGFTITPTAGSDGSFTYTTRSRHRTETCSNGVCTLNANVALQANFYSGTLTTTLDSSGSIVAFGVTGDLPASFSLGSNVLANDHSTWDMSGTRTISGFKQEISTLAGKLDSYGDATTIVGSLTVKSGQSTEIPVTADGTKPTSTQPATQGTIAGLSLDVLWSNAAAEFEGVFAATDSVWDKTGSVFLPSKLTLSGALRNIEAGVTTEFLSGVLSATATGYDAYDATSVVADSASNFYTVGASFVGTATAPSRPKLELTFGLSKKTYENDPSVTLQYKTYVGGAPRLVIGIAVSHPAPGTSVLTLSEATSTLSLALSSASNTAQLLLGGTELVGTFDKSSNLLTFTDGSFLSLDIGL